MKIAVFTDLFLPHVDGVTNSLVHLISQFRDMGHEVLVITPKTKDSETVQIPGIEIVFLPSVPSMVYPEFMLGFFSSKLLFTLRNFSPEVVHVVAPGPVGSMGLFYAKMVNIKSVAVFHGYFMEPEYLRIIGIKKRGVKLAQKVLWKFAKSFYDRADRVITPSKFVKKDLEKHQFARPITAIKNAIDFSTVKRSEKQHAAFVEQHGLKKKKVILYVGRVSVEKNIELLIRSLPLILKQASNAHLLIVGDGPDKERLESIVSELGLQQHITFTGQIKNTDLVKKDVFGVAEIFATASHSEVQPMSIIEAMQFGLPIVAAKSRGLTEMIQKNGYLVAQNDAQEFAKKVTEILKDSALQKKFSLRSKELAKEYSLEFTAQQHINVYSDLIANREDRAFLKRLLKSRIIKTAEDLIFLAGITHVTILTYLFFTRDKLEFINVFFILDLDKLFPNVPSSWLTFFISAIFSSVAFAFFFHQNRRKE